MSEFKTAMIKSMLLLTIAIVGVRSDNCKISWIETGHEVAESMYMLQLSVVHTPGDLRSYFPNTNYDITIMSKLSNVTFTQFYFAIWNQNKTKSYGTLELRENELSMFHNGPYCINRIIDGPVSLAKLRLRIGWQSPPADSGCVELRAVVKETELRYHVVNRTLCQDPRVQTDDPGAVLADCCACDDGKYELAFEGLWSRYTHPKHFPKREWIAVFPTVIGASHSPHYTFWQNYTMASHGLTEFALTGDTVDLEAELKANRSSINTLIKFRGANFQNKTRKSYAFLRVTKTKHVVSLVSKIEPSPDWFVGVSKLELCKSDCTWLESKTFNLYAFDVGARNGILYEDLEGYTNPQDVIQRLNMTWPAPRNSIESPFYDKTNNTHEVRPLARIHFKRLRGSEKSCQQVEPLEDCATEWSSWGPCSVDCGIGIYKRSRAIKPTYSEENCTLILEDSQTCHGNVNTCKKEVLQEDCTLTEWGEWSKCEKICGQEKISRSRSYVWSDRENECEREFGKPVLEEKMDCGNPPCPEDNFLCVDDRYNNWMEWSSCSVTQGSGFKLRARTVKEHLKKAHLEVPDADTDYGYNGCLYEKAVCEMSETLATSEDAAKVANDTYYGKKPDEGKEAETDSIFKPVNKPDYCLLPADEGICPDDHNDNSHRFYYDNAKGKCLPFRYTGCNGNENRFNDERICMKTCHIHGRRIDCEMSKWSSWTICRNCRQIRRRGKTVVVPPANGGRECPLMKVQKESCASIIPCPTPSVPIK